MKSLYWAGKRVSATRKINVKIIKNIEELLLINYCTYSRSFEFFLRNIYQSVRAAGFLLFRRKESIEFLLVKAFYRNHYCSTLKGLIQNGEDDLTSV